METQTVLEQLRANPAARTRYTTAGWLSSIHDLDGMHDHLILRGRSVGEICSTHDGAGRHYTAAHWHLDRPGSTRILRCADWPTARRFALTGQV